MKKIKYCLRLLLSRDFGSGNVNYLGWALQMPYLCLIVCFISDRDLFYCIAVHATHYKTSQLSCSHKKLTTHESKTSLCWFNLIKLSSIALNTGTFEGPPTSLVLSHTTYYGFQSAPLLLFLSSLFLLLHLHLQISVVWVRERKEGSVIID